jgi:hypothetical protein
MPSTGFWGGTAIVNVSGGVVTFSNLTINQVVTGYTLMFTFRGLASASSNLSKVTPRPAARLVVLFF